MYFYPMYIDDELINTIAESGKILPYIDIPLQHASDAVLRRMKRPTGRGNLLGMVERVRARLKKGGPHHVIFLAQKDVR